MGSKLRITTDPAPRLAFLVENQISDVPFLSRTEVASRIQFWHVEAASRNFSPNTHIVDPLAHYAYLDYLQNDVVQYSEYLRSSGEYDLDDDLYSSYPERLRTYLTGKEITDALWMKAEGVFSKCSSRTGGPGSGGAEPKLRTLQGGAASLRKSYSILCSTVVMLGHLRAWYFSTNFYSILTKDAQPDVARLVPISEQQLQALKTSIEKAVDRIATEGSTFLTIEGISKELVAPQLSSLQHDMRLTMAKGDTTDLGTILALLRMTVLVLDLALVSYVGSHGTPFHFRNGHGPYAVLVQHLAFSMALYHSSLIYDVNSAKLRIGLRIYFTILFLIIAITGN